MFLYFSKRVFGIFPTLIVISFAVFMIINLIPGDPASIIAGPSASAEQVAAQVSIASFSRLKTIPLMQVQ